MGFLNQPILLLLGNYKLMAALFLLSIEGPIKEEEFCGCMNKGSELCVGQVKQVVTGVEKKLDVVYLSIFLWGLSGARKLQTTTQYVRCSGEHDRFREMVMSDVRQTPGRGCRLIRWRCLVD